MSMPRQIRTNKELAEWKSTREFLAQDLENARTKPRPPELSREYWEIHIKQLETAVERCDLLIEAYENGVTAHRANN